MLRVRWWLANVRLTFSLQHTSCGSGSDLKLIAAYNMALPSYAFAVLGLSIFSTLSCSNSFDDDFHEEIYIKPLQSGHLYTHFQFTTKWDVELNNSDACKTARRCRWKWPLVESAVFILRGQARQAGRAMCTQHHTGIAIGIGTANNNNMTSTYIIFRYNIILRYSYNIGVGTVHWFEEY